MSSQNRLSLLLISIGLIGFTAVGCLQADVGVEPLAQSDAGSVQVDADSDEAPELEPEREPDVVYIPTPPNVVDAMLEVAEVQSDDLIYDLGSGDGRIVITAAEEYGARGVGIDIDPELVQQAQQNAQRAEVADLVEFRQADLFESDFSEATVVTLYLLPELNLKLRPKLLTELKPGTRIVSHAFDMGDWEPQEVVEIEGQMVYYWEVPEEVPESLL
ncbi:MAG: SAM-dependent methyltransferase [Elainellaceae cyanobacterium]